MGPGWLDFIADGALLVPEALEVSHGLDSVLHKSLDILLKACVFFILYDGLGSSLSSWGSWLVKIYFGSLPVLPVLELSPQELILDEIFWPTWLDDHCPEVIEHDVVYKGNSNRDPDQTEEDPKSSLENLSNDGKVAIDVKA